MKNKQLKKLFAVQYIPSLMNLEKVNSIKTCLLMSRLEALFSINPNGFYKFLEHNQLQELLPGECWTKELRITSHEFRTAFKSIGIRYESRQEYMQAADKFKGHYYCAIFDPVDLNRTQYLRNHQLVNQALRTLAK